MRVLVLYYSLYGNTYRMARAVAEGAGSAPHAQVTLMKVPETIRTEIIEKNERMRNAFMLQKGVPIARPDDLREYDALLFGSPARYGSMCAQMKNFLDQTGALWQEGALENKPAGVFTCSSLQYGGQEATLLSMLVPLLHLGMVVIGIPYSASRALTHHPGAPYGASAMVGTHEDRRPSEEDLELARILGRRVAQAAQRVRAMV